MPKLSLAKLERHLNSAADRLRQEGLDAATYKDYIFGMPFQKRCSNVFEAEHDRIVGRKVEEGMVRDEAEARFGENPDYAAGWARHPGGLEALVSRHYDHPVFLARFSQNPRSGHPNAGRVLRAGEPESVVGLSSAGQGGLCPAPAPAAGMGRACLPDSPMKRHTLDLCAKRAQFGRSYEHVRAHRTSNLVDRLMKFLDERALTRSTATACWLRPNYACARWPCCGTSAPRRRAPYHGQRCPAERLNGKRYVDDWLENLLVSGSTSGFRRYQQNPL
ncbi:MAG: type I restriction-modification system subunit M N-terminal domain-containing protein [Candidatus Competibacter sp.]|nr:type I restriction-modification system subunit M N-terminal domain-containing protein [Candidatus Competibacter sp.]